MWLNFFLFPHLITVEIKTALILGIYLTSTLSQFPVFFFLLHEVSIHMHIWNKNKNYPITTTSHTDVNITLTPTSLSAMRKILPQGWYLRDQAPSCIPNEERTDTTLSSKGWALSWYLPDLFSKAECNRISLGFFFLHGVVYTYAYWTRTRIAQSLRRVMLILILYQPHFSKFNEEGAGLESPELDTFSLLKWGENKYLTWFLYVKQVENNINSTFRRPSLLRMLHFIFTCQPTLDTRSV